METNPLIRGRMYNTSRVYRCPNYRQCKSCSQCMNHNPNNSLCNYCEGHKKNALQNTTYICAHDDEQNGKLIILEKVFNRRLSHVDDHEEDVKGNYEEFQKEMSTIKLEEDLDKMNAKAKFKDE